MDTFQSKFGEEITSLVTQLWEARNSPDAVESGEKAIKTLTACLCARGLRFEDPHFPADHCSLQAYFANGIASVSKKVEWRRPFIIGNPSCRPVVCSQTITADDVQQGLVGDFSFLTSTLLDQTWSAVTDLIIADGSELGIYGVKFFVDGRWTLVIVDDQFPCVQSGGDLPPTTTIPSKNAHVLTLAPVIGQFAPILTSSRIDLGEESNEKEFWSLILEKAWIKLSSSHLISNLGGVPTQHSYATHTDTNGSPPSLVAPEIVSRLQAGVDLFFRKQDKQFVEDVFRRHSHADPSNGKQIVQGTGLQGALGELGIRISVQEAESLVFTLDIDRNGGLDWEEFHSAVLRPPTELDQWVSSIPLSSLLASCLQVVVPDGDQLRQMSRLSSESLEAVAEATSNGLKRLLAEAHEELKKVGANMDAKAQAQKNGTAAKFDTFKMTTGSVKEYFDGLVGRVGSPNLKFTQGIRNEHCFMGGYDYKFTTGNYGITTTPKREYQISTGQLDCDPKELLDKNNMPVRVIIPLNKLKELDLCKTAKLTDDEILVVVLYTGPMFVIYNAILRQYEKDIYNFFKEKRNLFSTTIFVLVSAIIKIARVTKIPPGLELFRGLGGTAELPDSFWKADGVGCRGYMEWGFLSTTSHRETAIQYSGAVEGKPLPMAIQTNSASIDRGACIKDLSQYPGEVEYLWPPCSYLEPTGPPRLVEARGLFLKMLPVRINSNGKALTVDELLEQKKSLHVNTFRYMVDELGLELKKIEEDHRNQETDEDDDDSEDSDDAYFDLDEERQVFIDVLVEKCKVVLAKHKNVHAKEFLNDATYRELVSEMLDTKSSALCSLRLVLEDDTVMVDDVSELSLAETRRQYLGFLERQANYHENDDTLHRRFARRICEAMGILRKKVDERDADGMTRLMVAAADGEGSKTIRMLVAARANVNATDSQWGKTPLCLAAESGHPEIVVTLVELKADINFHSSEADTPIIAAASKGHRDVILALAKQKADINARYKDDMTPLHIAVSNGHVDAVFVLVKCKADVNVKNKEGETPLTLARSEMWGEKSRQIAEILGISKSEQGIEDDGNGEGGGDDSGGDDKEQKRGVDQNEEQEDGDGDGDADEDEN